MSSKFFQCLTQKMAGVSQCGSQGPQSPYCKASLQAQLSENSLRAPFPLGGEVSHRSVAAKEGFLCCRKLSHINHCIVCIAVDFVACRLKGSRGCTKTPETAQERANVSHSHLPPNTAYCSRLPLQTGRHAIRGTVDERGHHRIEYLTKYRHIYRHRV